MNECPFSECQTTAGCAHRGPAGQLCYGRAAIREGTLLQRVERLERIVERLFPDKSDDPAPRWEIGKNGWDASDEATREDI